MQVEEIAVNKGLVVEEPGRRFEKGYKEHLWESYNKYSHEDTEILIEVQPKYVEVWDTSDDGYAFQLFIDFENKTVEPKIYEKNKVNVKKLPKCDNFKVTSGGYERYFEEDGETYIHIINPRTGYPADGDLLSVTIVSKDGTLADGMSTALYIMGYEKACQFWRQHREGFNVILVTDDGKIHISENLKGNFQTEWELEMIESGSE